MSLSQFARAVVTTVCAFTLIACGGGADSSSPPLPSLTGAQLPRAQCEAVGLEDGRYTLRNGQCLRSGRTLKAAQSAKHSLSVPLVAAAASGPLTAAELMNWAEANYPSLFPAAQRRDGTLGDYVVFRYYASTQNFLALSAESDGWAAYLYGAATNWQVVYEGRLADFACLVRGGTYCKAPTDGTRLLFSQTGVALSSTPSLSRTTATLTIRDTGAGNIGWKASTDKSWLTITTNGTTSAGHTSTMNISANVSVLPMDQVSIATVTLTPNDNSVQSPEQMVVGVWRGSTTPTQMVKLEKRYAYIVADTVRPLVYVHDGHSTIDIYNLYKQKLEASITNVGGVLGQLAVAQDGSTLYALDTANRNVAVVDLRTHEVHQPLPLSVIATPATGLAFARPSGIGMLITGDQSVYRLSPWTRVYAPQYISEIASSVAISPDSSRAVFTKFGGALLYSLDIDGDSLSMTYLGAGGGTNGKDAAFSKDGAKFYTASGSPYVCESWDATNSSALGALPAEAYPTSVEVGSDGRVYCGIFGWYSTYDVWVYTPLGSYVTGFKFAGYAHALIDRGLVLGADGLTGAALTDDPLIVLIPFGQ